MEDPRWVRHQLPGSFVILGSSVGARYSAFYVPSLQIMFDAGIPCPYALRDVFVTHCHEDHSFQLPICNLTASPRVFVPAETIGLVEDFMRASLRLRCGTVNARGSIVPRGVAPDDCVAVTGHPDWLVRVYALVHSVPTCGYGLCQRRSRLRAQYRGAAPLELKNLRALGTEISEDYLFFKLAYLCDTTPECFELAPELLFYETIVVECTFYRDKDYGHPRSRYHTHWRDLKPIVVAHPEVHFVLVHFSTRTAPAEVQAFFALEAVTNVEVWV